MNPDTEINFNQLILNQIEVKERWQRELAEIEKREALGTKTSLDRVARAEAKQNIKLAEDAIADLNKQKNELANLEQQEARATTMAQEREIVEQLIKDYHVGYEIPEGRFMM